MFSLLGRCIAFVLIIFTNTLLWAGSVTLSSSQIPPYLYQHKDTGVKGGISGILNCMFSNIDYEYRVVFKPQKRGQMEVLKGLSQGAVLESKEVASALNTFLSAPLVLQKWYLYYPADAPSTSLHPKNNIAIMRGSGAKIWLNLFKNNHENIRDSNIWQSLFRDLNLIEINSPKQILLMLKNKRVSGAIIDEKVFTSVLDDEDIARTSFQRRFIKYTPLGVLFNQKFLNDNPVFLDEFNQQIPLCTIKPTTLSHSEKNQVQGFAKKVYKNILAELIQDPITLEHILPSKDMAEIMVLDRQWRKEVESKKYRLIAEVINRPLSKRLTYLKNRDSKFITEILLMDHQGILIATSDITTDYWQGDEEKFQKTFPSKELFVSDLQYDNSTQTFQVQVSFPIISEVSRNVTGVLTIGLDIEHILIHH